MTHFTSYIYSFKGYILQGIITAKLSIPLGILLWILCNTLFIVIKKRSIHDIKKTGCLNVLCELLLAVYVCTILSITGILRRDFSYTFSLPVLASLFKIPFKGASIKMAALNCFLFIPYGFLVFTVFGKKQKVYSRKIFLTGFCSSFFIELIQSFTGRFPEADDLIANTAGFLVGYIIAQGFFELRNKNIWKHGVLKMTGTVLILSASLLLLSFWANGDAIQSKQDAYYTEIGKANLEEEISSLLKLNIIKNNALYDIRHDEETADNMLYIWIGTDISNHAGQYVTKDCLLDIESIKDADKIYIEIEYSQPQTFRFYNNQSWDMLDVVTLIFCVDDGTLWYGTQRDSIEKCAQYSDSEHEYQADAQLLEYISKRISSSN